MSNSSIQPIDRTLSGATTPGQSGPRSDANEDVFCISQSSSITESSALDCLVAYPGHPLGESYPSAEMQLVYSAVLANWVTFGIEGKIAAVIFKKLCINVVLTFTIRIMNFSHCFFFLFMNF